MISVRRRVLEPVVYDLGNNSWKKNIARDSAIFFICITVLTYRFAGCSVNSGNKVPLMMARKFQQ